MPFPDDAIPFLFYRQNCNKGTIKKTSFQGEGIDKDTSWFHLKRNQLEKELKYNLKQLAGPPLFLERFELVYVSSDRKQPIALDSRIPSETPYRIFRQGLQETSDSRMRRAGDNDDLKQMIKRQDLDTITAKLHRGNIGFLSDALRSSHGRFISETVVALREDGDIDPHCMLASASGPGRQFVSFRINLDKATGRLLEFTIIWNFSGEFFKPHAITSLTPVHWRIELGGESNKKSWENAGRITRMLQDNFKMISEKFRIRLHKTPLFGWNSWDHYKSNISEEIIYENLRALDEKKLKLNFFLIDDGYQETPGEWLKPNDKFPSGMTSLAREIRAHEMRPGIWLAPLLVRPGSKMYDENKEILLRNVNDTGFVRFKNVHNWDGPAYVLDVTHPKTAEWIRQVVHTMVHTWGFSFLKLDYLNAACIRGLYHNAGSAPAVRLQDLLTLIRRAAGRKTFLLGCNCPLFPAAGIIDGMRISSGVDSYSNNKLLSRFKKDRGFLNIKPALINIIVRSSCHRNLWMNDPNRLFSSAVEAGISESQLKLTASIIALSGGLLTISENIAIIEEARLEIINRCYEINSNCALHTPIPLGLMLNEFPRGVYNPAGYIGLWNPTPRPEMVKLRIPSVIQKLNLDGAVDCWSGLQMPWKLGGDKLYLSLDPYGCMVAKI